MALLFVFIAGIIASFGNLLIRKNLEYGGTTRGLLVLYFLITFIGSLFLYPIFQGPWSAPMAVLGGIGGILNMALLFFTNRALESGPPGLTFAFQNSCCVVPGIVLFALFGPEFGFELTASIILGFLFVIGGLFWSAHSEKKIGDKRTITVSKKWIYFAFAMFFIQGFSNTLFQWRCILSDFSVPDHPLIPFKYSQIEDIWIVPSMFAVASFFQMLLFIFTERRFLKRSEIIFGGLGGLLNIGSGHLLLIAAPIATPFEKGLLLPTFAVTVIVCCNFWGQKLYRERVNWKANALCVAGVLLGIVK